MSKRSEIRRHERAVVLQELGAVADDPRAWQSQRKIEVSRMKRALKRGGGHHEARLGLVTKGAVAGGNGTPHDCLYCDQDLPYHNADCPVIS